jgi:hypothetical protein
MIVGFTGPIGCGKSYAAAYLVSRGFVLHKMAAPLKSMLRTVGLTDDHIEGRLKEVPCDLLMGVTPRRAMQTLGAEWGRDLIHPDLWVHLWQNSRPLTHTVCDDVRYPNEARAIRNLDGVVVQIDRPGVVAAGGHSSETFDGVRADLTIVNDGTDAFRGRLDNLLAQILPS